MQLRLRSFLALFAFGTLACGERVVLADLDASSRGGRGGAPPTDGSGGRTGSGTGGSAGAAIVLEPGAITWRSSFDIGDLSEWDRDPQFVGSGITLVDSPTRSGAFAAQFEVGPGDDPIANGDERAELIRTPFEGEGTSSYWAWSTFFPSDFVAATGAHQWTILVHWVADGDLYPDCRPPLVVDIDPADGQSLRLLTRGGTPVVSGGSCTTTTTGRFVLEPIVRNRWYDFFLWVVWSADPAVGRVRLFLDGREVVPETAVATLYSGSQVSPKLGLYRSPASTTTRVIHDELRHGSESPEGF